MFDNAKAKSSSATQIGAEVVQSRELGSQMPQPSMRSLESADDLRQLFGETAKHLLPQNWWDFSGPLVFTNPAYARLAGHCEVKCIIDAFLAQTSKRMRANSDESHYWRWILNEARIRISGPARMRVRKKRVSRLRQFFLLTAKRRADLPRGAWRGYTCAAAGIKKCCMSPRRKGR